MRKLPAVLMFPKWQHPVTPSFYEAMTLKPVHIFRRPAATEQVATASSSVNTNKLCNRLELSGSKEEVKKEKSPAVLVFKKWQHPERKQPLYDSTSPSLLKFTDRS
ncbi:hypothetical protein AABB24_004843, partial [Solanum stoloniferum]